MAIGGEGIGEASEVRLEHAFAYWIIETLRNNIPLDHHHPNFTAWKIHRVYVRESEAYRSSDHLP